MHQRDTYIRATVSRRCGAQRVQELMADQQIVVGAQLLGGREQFRFHR